jgi:hypothetical protein
VHVTETQTAEQDFREIYERNVDLMLGRLLKRLANEDERMEVLCQDHFVIAAARQAPLGDTQEDHP